ncbi:MAG: hypothetical protein ABIH67_00710 [Candidatus Uhrbacteria bacterium]
MKINFNKKKLQILKRGGLGKKKVDIGGRDIVIGFSEPAFKKSNSRKPIFDLDSKLNARFITYFLPAIEIARMQAKRPRFFVISGINMSMKWNANSEDERKIMLANTKIKFDFLQTFFEELFNDDFSLVEYISVQDPLKISEKQVMQIWNLLVDKDPKEAEEVKLALARFKNPNLFNNKKKNKEMIKSFLNSSDQWLTDALKYTISHLFAFGDLNFEGNYYLNPKGFLSIGGHQEAIFNKVRNTAFDIIKKLDKEFFDEKVIMLDNVQLVLEDDDNVPPPYNGFYKKTGNKLKLEEVTYENDLPISYYNWHKKLAPQMKYMYENFLTEVEYQKFWKNYKDRYTDLKNRYNEAYEIDTNW